MTSDHVDLDVARRIMDGYFIERLDMPEMVTFSRDVLTEARERGFNLTFIPSGTLHEHTASVLALLDDSFRYDPDAPYMRTSAHASWLFTKYVLPGDRVDAGGVCGVMLSVRDLVLAASAYELWKGIPLFTDRVRTGDCDPRGMSHLRVTIPELILVRKADRISVESVHNESDLRALPQIVGIRPSLR